MSDVCPVMLFASQRGKATAIRLRVSSILAITSASSATTLTQSIVVNTDDFEDPRRGFVRVDRMKR